MTVVTSAPLFYQLTKWYCPCHAPFQEYLYLFIYVFRFLPQNTENSAFYSEAGSSTLHWLITVSESLLSIHINCKSRNSQMFFKIGILCLPEVFFKTCIQKVFAKCTIKHLSRGLFLNKAGHVTIYFHFWFYKILFQNQSLTSVLVSSCSGTFCKGDRKTSMAELLFQ